MPGRSPPPALSGWPTSALQPRSLRHRAWQQRHS